MSVSAPLLAHQAQFELEAGPHAAGELAVVSFEATEALSRPFEVFVALAAEHDLDVDVAGLIGKPALLTVHGADGEARFFNGVISRMSQSDDGGSAQRRRFQAVIVPSLWLLKNTRKSRIFHELTTPEIVAKVLDEHKVKHQATLRANYHKREFCVQYRETDFQFVSRLLEEEGITYLFDHAQKEHTLQLLDAQADFQALPGGAEVVYRASAKMLATEEHVEALTSRVLLQPGAVALRDFNYQRPGQDLTTQAKHKDGDESLEVYDFPGGYQEQGPGQSRSKIRLEELRARAQGAEGQSGVRRLIAGHTLELKEHPDPAFNGKYLLTSVTHRGEQRETLAFGQARREGEDSRPYVNHFTCMPADIPFRPERLTPKPVITGAQTAKVIGEGGEEISTDALGRIKVHFHWDRESAGSCWLRVSQSWAGPGWGALFLPRVGHEVVVEFLEGDPDRPLVTGSVYNGSNPPPLDLPSEKTKSTLRTSSSPGGSGSNELRFEDAAGAEEVYLHAQRDLSIVVENDKTQSVGGNESLTVRKNRSRVIQGHQQLQVQKNDDSTIGGNQSLTVNGNRTTTVGGNHTESIGGDQIISVGAAQAVTVALASTETVGAAKSVTVGGALSVAVGAAMNEVVGGFRAEQVGGSKSETIGGSKTETIVGARSVTVGGDMSEELAKSRSLKVAKDLFISAGGKVNLTAKDAYTLSAKEINLVAEESFVAKIGSATFTLKKNGDVVLKGGKIELTASGDVIIKGSKISEN